jgi:hypothetical protein
MSSLIRTSPGLVPQVVKRPARRAGAGTLPAEAGTGASTPCGGAGGGSRLGKMGFTLLDAIRAATSLSVERFGLGATASVTGAPRPGLEADVIVLSGNPLQGIRG